MILKLWCKCCQGKQLGLPFVLGLLRQRRLAVKAYCGGSEVPPIVAMQAYHKAQRLASELLGLPFVLRLLRQRRLDVLLLGTLHECVCKCLEVK